VSSTLQAATAATTHTGKKKEVMVYTPVLSGADAMKYQQHQKLMVTYYSGECMHSPIALESQLSELAMQTISRHASPLVIDLPKDNILNYLTTTPTMHECYPRWQDGELIAKLEKYL
jgi:hypothetical protein